ncbi:MAG: 23S rRNA (adenine(2030)-N(6))-methyltransferase RlmJ [Rhodopila sp.]|jgi:23S rRNA (adenine2030-N6)-methyltransferase
MNYRHAYHAGNFADCFKHALLVGLLDFFARKPTPYFVLDTHAGMGRYDLEADAAQRTGEADAGIRRLLANQPPANQPPALGHYLELVQTLGLYPGSPTLIRTVMRPGDRLACCELHPEDVIPLRRQFHHDPQVDVHSRSGWEALKALLPPREKRGLVFIDPPFENPDEFATLADGLKRGHSRFGHGVFAAWYPIKQRAVVRGFHAALEMAEIRDIIAIELYLREATNAAQLNGCGLLVINPPYQFAEQGRSVAEAVLDGLGRDESGAGVGVIRIVDE